MTDVRVVGRLDPSVAWDGSRLLDDEAWHQDEPPTPVYGGATVVARRGSGWRLARDPLGINKLFWALGPQGEVLTAARPKRLVDAGVAFRDVNSLPPGTVVDIHGDGVRRRGIEPDVAGIGHESNDPRVVGPRIRDRLERYLLCIASTYRDAPVFVCLSGGLDSSAVSAIAREIFPDLIAVSFDLRLGNYRRSEDRVAAARLARDLGIPLLLATPTPDELLHHIDSVLVEGVDWRDFNVHAGLVNAAIADTVSRASGGSGTRAFVVTGDLANEFLVDYHEEHHAGRTYYELPRLDPGALRRFLVKGLDTSHREVGIFGERNLCTLQPYAVAVEEFSSLSVDFLAQPDRKEELYREMVGRRLPEYIYARKKVRAQMGSAGGGGVLSVCADRSIDERWLRDRFAALHDTEPNELNRFIRGGVYRRRIPGAKDST